MKDRRHGDHLWMEWTGDGYEPETETDLIFYTEEVVDIEIPLIQKALASALQREGIVDSLSDGYSLISNAVVVHGFVGSIEKDIVPTACDVYGNTALGEHLQVFTACTWVELPVI